MKTWADLDKPAVRIAVPQASSMDKFLTEQRPKAEISRFPGNAEAIAAFQAGPRRRGVPVPPAAARGAAEARQPARSSCRRRRSRRRRASRVRKEADKSFVEWVDKEIGKYYASGQTQKWYEEFLVGFGLDPKASPPVMKEMLGKS